MIGINETTIGTMSQEKAQACRLLLLEKYNEERPWFYVYENGTITVAGEFGGKMDEEICKGMKEFISNWKIEEKEKENKDEDENEDLKENKEDDDDLPESKEIN